MCEHKLIAKVSEINNLRQRKIVRGNQAFLWMITEALDDFISYHGESMNVSFTNVRRSVTFVKDFDLLLMFICLFVCSPSLRLLCDFPFYLEDSDQTDSWLGCFILHSMKSYLYFELCHQKTNNLDRQK